MAKVTAEVTAKATTKAVAEGTSVATVKAMAKLTAEAMVEASAEGMAKMTADEMAMAMAKAIAKASAKEMTQVTAEGYYFISSMFVKKYFGIIIHIHQQFVGETLALTQTQHVTCDSVLQVLHLCEYIRECEFNYCPPNSKIIHATKEKESFLPGEEPIVAHDAPVLN
jgi:hypothetical protein